MDMSVVLNNPEERLRFTLESIKNWLDKSPDIRLVICDGSDYDFAPVLLKHFPNDMYSNRIECLHFLNNSEKVAEFGKGYGEGEIVQYALKHSKFIEDSNCFCKCTGKLWVDNFSECLNEWNGRFLCQAYFSKGFTPNKTKFEHIDTRFYISSKEIYEKYFINLHLEVGGHFNCSIEDAFKRVIVDNNLTGTLFQHYPIVRGVGGGSGKHYKTNFIRRNKDRLRLKFVQLNPKFSKWFNQI
jgi:hypothetical protein